MTETEGVARNAPSGAAAPGGGTADNEEVLRLDDKLYEDLKAAALRSRSRFGIAELLGREKEKVDAFLYWEARLLDSKRYRDWVELLSADFVYWIPGSPDAIDPRLEGAVNFDDRRRLIDRITLTETNVQWAQIPRSRTCRMITNIESFQGAAGAVHVRSNVAIWEYRRGQAQSYIGWQEHELLTAGEQWRIRRKFINLLECDQPQGNNTFIL